MRVAEYIVYVFSIFFVFYSVSAFLKSRKREFGVLIMHGMTYNQLRGIVFIESMVIGSASIVAGLAAGMLFARLFMMIGADVMQMSPLPYYMPSKAILLTLIAFVLLFLVISAFTAAFVRASKPIDLLKGSAKPKPEPKSSVFLSITAFCLLLAGYIISFMAKGVTVVSLFAGHGHSHHRHLLFVHTVERVCDSHFKKQPLSLFAQNECARFF